jgi:hypothetical protein
MDEADSRDPTYIDIEAREISNDHEVGPVGGFRSEDGQGSP